MKLKNPFPSEVRELYIFENCCHECGSNQMLELHHILSRVSSSPLNCRLLCHKCHTNYTNFDKGLLLRKQLEWLVLIGYKFKDVDYDFYNKYIRYYENNNSSKASKCK